MAEVLTLSLAQPSASHTNCPNGTAQRERQFGIRHGLRLDLGVFGTGPFTSPRHLSFEYLEGHSPADSNPHTKEAASAAPEGAER